MSSKAFNVRLLFELCKKIKSLGYLVKLDTNGTNPDMLKLLIKEKLVDYIAMDIKSSLESYDKVVGVKAPKEKIKECIDIIMNSNIDYEFRTTIIPDIIDEDEIKKIADLLVESKKFFIQQFMPNEKIIGEKYRNMEPLPEEKLEEFKNILNKKIKKIEIKNTV